MTVIPFIIVGSSCSLLYVMFIVWPLIMSVPKINEIFWTRSRRKITVPFERYGLGAIYPRHARVAS